MSAVAEIIAKAVKTNVGCGCDGACGHCLSDAQAILSALSEAGYAVVPREPTKEMILRGETALENFEDSTLWSTPDGEMQSSYTRSPGWERGVWQAMIEAAGKQK